ncbi:MAG: beta-glucosidase, partial [Halieaceae bacterium]
MNVDTICSELNAHYEKQIKDLLADMTLREKLGQCVMIEPCFCLEERVGEEFGESYDGILDPAYLAKLLDEYGIGSFLFGGVSRVGDGSPEAWAEYISKVEEHVTKTRLKIPMIYGIDAVHGVNFMKGSTIYSHNLGVAATWNPDLAKDYASLVGAELMAIGFNCNFAPTIDVARDQRWGRVYESMGEDPYLASRFSEALVQGTQVSGYLAACAKHFVGYGESSNGMDRTQADLSERSILETHVPPFEAAIESGVLSIMVAGGDVNAVPVPASKKM